MAGIDLSRLTTLGGRTTTNGLISGLNVAAIINTLVAARSQPIDRVEGLITTNSQRISAYGSLRNSLDLVQSGAGFLRKPPGIGGVSGNTFEFRNTSLSESGVISATASPGAGIANYQIAVTNLAKALATRSSAFSTNTGSVTEAAGGSTAGLFSAGTFKLTSTLATATGDKLAASDYSVTGTASGILTAAGIQNFSVTNSSGDRALRGGISGFTATYNGVDDTDVSVTVNGTVYTADSLADSLSGGDFITFTSSTGTSFQVQLSGAVSLTDQTEANTFATNLGTALSSQSIYQRRGLENVNASASLSSDLSDLEFSDISFNSNAFAANGTQGSIGEFTVTAVSATGAGDGSISVQIDGETYTASGLGNASDIVTGTITLTAASGKSLRIALPAGSELNFSGALDDNGVSTTAKIEKDLDLLFSVKSADITINEGDSLVDIAAAINSKTADTGFTAKIIQVSATEFRLDIQSTLTGYVNQFSIVDPDDVIGDVTFTTQQAAENATFTLDGIELERSTNTVNNVVSGVNITLLDDEDGSTITLSITRDTNTAKNGIINFINTINDFLLYAQSQLPRDDGNGNISSGILGNEALLRTIFNQINTEITRNVGNVSNTDFSSLVQIGVNIEEEVPLDGGGVGRNLLSLDEEVLDDYLENNFEELRQIFEFTFTSTSQELSVFKSSNDITLNNFKLDIDTSRAAGDKVRVYSADGLTLLYNADLVGSKIVGQAGTSIEGLELVYSGDGTDVIDVSLSQGIADRVYNFLDENLTDDGTFDTIISDLENENDNFEDDIVRLEEQLASYETSLIAQYADLEQQIQQANYLLLFVDTQNQFLFNNN